MSDEKAQSYHVCTQAEALPGTISGDRATHEILQGVAQILQPIGFLQDMKIDNLCGTFSFGGAAEA